MKNVEFVRDMRPYAAGATLVVPDEVAARLEAEGAVRNVRPWPERTESGVPVVPVKPQAEKPRPAAPAKRQYVTK